MFAASFLSSKLCLIYKQFAVCYNTRIMRLRRCHSGTRDIKWARWTLVSSGSTANVLSYSSIQSSPLYLQSVFSFSILYHVIMKMLVISCQLQIYEAQSAQSLMRKTRQAYPKETRWWMALQNRKWQRVHCTLPHSSLYTTATLENVCGQCNNYLALSGI